MNARTTKLWMGILAAPAAFLLGGSNLVQQQSGGRLQRVQELDSRREVDPQGNSTGQGTPWEQESWRENLGVPDLDQRERAYERMLDGARGNAQARAQLERWSKDDSDPGFAWTARLALRELERSEHPFGRMGTYWTNSEDGHGLGRLYLGGQRSLRGFDFRGLQGLHGFNVVPRQFFDYEFGLHNSGTSAGAQSSSKSQVQLSIQPDGVEATVTREVDGVEQSLEYSAESMEALLDAHPELRDDLGGISIGTGVPFGSLQGSGGLSANFFRFDAGANLHGLFGRSSVRSDILGVYVRTLAEALDLGAVGLPDSGLWIEAIAPGTIAAKLGMQRGQTLVEMNGRPMNSRDDISSALQGRDAQDEITVGVVDPSGESKTLSWTPAAQTDAGRSLPEQNSQGLRRL